MPGTAHHVRRVRCEGPSPGDLDPAERKRGAGASALEGGPARLPPSAVAGAGLAARPGGKDARIQDALATFDADEVVVALHPEDETPFVERVARADLRPSVDGVPVRAIVLRDPL